MSYGESSGASDETVAAYLDLLERLHLTESLPGWEPPLRAKARVRVKPKRYFVDPSLAAALLGAAPGGLLSDTQTLGLLFENLVVRDLRVYLSTLPGLGNRLSYYRDDKGLEVDLVAESGGRWAGIEVKLSDTKADEAAESLLRLRAKVLSNPSARAPEPAFLAVVVGRGSLAYRRPDGVLVVPRGRARRLTRRPGPCEPALGTRPLRQALPGPPLALPFGTDPRARQARRPRSADTA